MLGLLAMKLHEKFFGYLKFVWFVLIKQNFDPEEFCSVY